MSSSGGQEVIPQGQEPGNEKGPRTPAPAIWGVRLTRASQSLWDTLTNDATGVVHHGRRLKLHRLHHIPNADRSPSQRMCPPGGWPGRIPGLSLHSSWWKDCFWGLGSGQARVTQPHRQNPHPRSQVGHGDSQHWLQAPPLGRETGLASPGGGRGRGPYGRLSLSSVQLSSIHFTDTLYPRCWGDNKEHHSRLCSSYNRACHMARAHETGKE